MLWSEEMEASATRRVLIVAHRTAASPPLIDAVRVRALEGPFEPVLLVPASPHGFHRAVDPEDQGRAEAEAVIEMALPLLEEAAGRAVEARVGDHDPLAAVSDALNSERFDEVIVSTLPRRVSRWLHLDLPRKVAGLGVPVTTVTARGRASAGSLG
jgi:hypothetical protein